MTVWRYGSTTAEEVVQTIDYQLHLWDGEGLRTYKVTLSSEEEELGGNARIQMANELRNDQSE